MSQLEEIRREIEELKSYRAVLCKLIEKESVKGEKINDKPKVKKIGVIGNGRRDNRNS